MEPIPNCSLGQKKGIDSQKDIHSNLEKPPVL